MKRLRQFVSLVLVMGIAATPLLSVGCNGDQTTPSEVKKPDVTPKPVDAPKTKDEKKKDKPKPKASSSSAESGSTTGSGVKPPVK
jgi:hypothetical protein